MIDELQHPAARALFREIARRQLMQSMDLGSAFGLTKFDASLAIVEVAIVLATALGELAGSPHLAADYLRKAADYAALGAEALGKPRPPPEIDAMDAAAEALRAAYAAKADGQ